jgi:protein tyrosine/serine phosphatase
MADIVFHPIQNVHNFRDYGGYPSRFGGRVRRGLLFRSGHHVEASDSDLDLIEPLGIDIVIDLRGESERDRYPCRRHAGWSGKAVFHRGETSSSPPHEAGAARDITPAYAEKRMLEVYSRMPHNPGMIAVFSLYLRELAATDKASLVHCFAGKDRTGIAVMLLHHVLGVSREDARKDYLATNRATTLKVLARQSIPRLEERYGPLDPEAVRALLEVRKTYLDRFLDEVEHHHGSLDAYIERVLAIGERTADALRERLLA